MSDDDLEIISIGALYSGGQWDKKYWSCSRGKDRYPYPVGYLAIRTHAGNKYRMEIHEGPKGPVFLVTSPDGNSFTGQTPDIAWGDFQKKNFSRVKNWPGKRLSSTDAVELFGFKNPFVQRLLRELVANVNGVVERDLVTKTNCHSVSNVSQGKPEKSHRLPDLHPFLTSKQITRKRSTMNNYSAEPRNKRRHSQVSLLDGECNSSKESKQEDGTLDVYNDNNSEEDHTAVMDISNNETIDQIYNSADKILGSATRKERGKTVKSASQMKMKATKQKKPLDDMLEEKDSLPLPNNISEEHTENGRYLDACVPDTCDTQKCNIIDSQMDGQRTNLCMKNEVQVECTQFNVMKNGVVNNSLPEAGSFSGSSSLNSEKYDLDLAGQELAKSMMTFLLPRAVPLLTKTYVRRRSKNQKNKMGSFKGFIKIPAQEKMNNLEALPCKDFSCNNVTDPFIGNGYLKDTKYEVPDSLDADHIHVTDIDKGYPQTLPEATISLSDGAKINIESPLLPDGVNAIPDSEDTKNVIPDSLEDSLEDKQSELEIRTVDERKENIKSTLLPDERGNEYSDRLVCLGRKFVNEVGKDIMPNRTCSTDMCPYDHLNLDIDATLNSKGDNVMNKVFSSTSTHLEDGYKSDMIVNHKTYHLCKPNILQSSNSMNAIQQMDMIPLPFHDSRKGTMPLSESVVCRNYTENSLPELPSPQQIPKTNMNNANSNAAKRVATTKNEFIGNEELCETFVHAPPVLAPNASQIHDVDKCVPEDTISSQFNDSFILDCDNIVRDFILPKERCMQSHTQDPKKGYLDNSSAKIENSKWDTMGSMELLGCFLHPSPVLSVSLSSKGGYLQICVLCGLVGNNIKNIFMYEIHGCEHGENSPSFIGYTPLMLSPNSMQYPNISVEKSGLQYVVGRKSVVIVDSIKAPRCRDQNFNCSCTDCTLCHSEEYTVEIVQMNFGYVSSAVRLPTTEKVSFILACEPNYLIAVMQSGKLHVWVMNLEWSASIEEFLLPQFNELSPGMLELKTVPNFKYLVLGHNGLGGFALWDISKRVLVSKFVSPCITTFQIHPIGLSEWTSDDSVPTWCPKANEDLSLTSSNDNVAVWLLISACADTDAQDVVERAQTVPIGCWRLALLVKSSLILGSLLNPRTSAVGISQDFGIYGTTDGLLYKCKLSTGEALKVLHPFKNGSVAQIATDANSGAVAVADNGCQLLVYAGEIYKN